MASETKTKNQEAEDLGWKWDEDASEWRLNDDGDGCDAVAPTAEDALRISRLSST